VRCRREISDVRLAVRHDLQLGRELRDLHEPFDLPPADHLGRNEDVEDAASDEHLGFPELSRANASGARGDLFLSDKRRLVGFAVRPIRALLLPADISHVTHVLLEDIEIDE
jgi:hypothetical protein